MKKFIQWLAKVFNANITIKETETIVKEVEKKVPVFDGEVVRGDLKVEGNLVVEGYLEVYGNVTAKGGVGAYGVKANVSCLNK